MLTLQEQIEEVETRLRYWENELAEVNEMGRPDELEDILEEARGGVNLCLEELASLRNELDNTQDKR
jgi:hypothetical protein